MDLWNRRAAACFALATGLAGSVSAASLTDIRFTSNSGSFVNDTILDNFSSPLAITNSSGLDQPFLNAPNSTVSLGYGSYYAIAFLGFGQHIGQGSISLRVDGGSVISQSVVFPNPASASAVFATFALPGGDTVTFSATGLSANRIQIVADGGGLTPDPNGTPDAFYLMNYAPVPEPTPAQLMLAGLALFGLVGRRFTRPARAQAAG